MRFSRKKRQHNDVGVVITSMLDINFLLIMFFLMTAHFQRETHALLNLPQEKGEEKAQPDEAALVINITKDGEIIVSGAAVSLEELRGRVREHQDRVSSDAEAGVSSKSLKLMVRADREAGSQDLNRVVFALRELGVGTIRIATEAPK